MELTLKRLLEQAKFTTTRKGYDQDEVDDFLDRAVAMATKVEARLTQALADAGKGGAAEAPAAPAAPTRSDADIQAEIAAEVEKRVQARVAEIESAAPARQQADDTAAAEEAARTLVLAQRTADAAISEARQEAEQIAAQAKADAEEQRRGLAEQTEKERSEARGRLAREIHALEEARDGLRADVSTLEGHVEEQRVQLQSTVAELQRLLDDPSAFRLPPAPQTRQGPIPDLVEDPPSGAPSGDAVAAPSERDDSGTEPAGARAGGPEPTSAPAADVPGSEPAQTAAPDEADRPERHKVPDTTDPEASLDVGPPTAPVSIVDLDLGSPADPIAVASGHTDAGAARPVEGDDAFLAELRKAMADEEPLGPRDVDLGGGQQDFLDDERRGWRFGKRR